MPTVLQLRRGTTAQNNSFTGAAGELSVNTSNASLRVHDGTTAGGTELATLSYASSASNLSTGTLGAARLPTSGVSAATYGNATYIPSVVVDTYGRITSASNVVVNVANTNIVGNITGSQLAPTAVTASTYGGGAVQTIITVDPQGRITSASNVTSTVANTNITGNIIGSQIATTGVTAGTYGGAATVPVYTVDQQGRLSSASNATISIPSSAINTDIALGTQTSGAYVANLVAGTGVTLSGLGNEGTTPTIAIGQAVATTSDVQFAKLNTTGQVRVTDATNSTGAGTGALIVSGGGSIGGNLYISGNLIVSGTQTVFNSNTFSVTDPMIYMGGDNSSDVVDLGFVASFTNPGYQHSGFVRDASDGVWKLFANVVAEPTTTVDFTNATYSPIQVGAFTGTTGTFTGNVSTGNISGTAASFTYSRLGTVQTGTWNGTSISTAYTDAKLTSVSATSPIATDASTGAITLSHSTSGVSAATYGNATFIPQYVVNSTGHITSASNVTVNVANTNIIGNISGTQLAPTAVTASTYGGAAVQTIITVDPQGRITSASNVTSTVANTNITGNIIGSQIAATGVTAGTYGGAATVPVYTVDQQGRITSATNVAITAGVTSITGTSNQITASASTGAVTLSTPQSIGTASSVQFGSFGVGTAASGTTGEIRATNNITAYYSDDRLKTRIGNIENAINKVETLSTFYYEPNETAQALGYAVERNVGLSAQEVQKILPEVVKEAPISSEYLTIQYEKLVPLLVAALKEQQEQINNLKYQIELLNG